LKNTIKSIAKVFIVAPNGGIYL